jgi:hypothetical protein
LQRSINKIPERPLKIGEYLFYAGRISARALSDSLVWQARQRPLFGKIACGWGFMSEDQVRVALARRGHNKPIGECAVRLGFLTPFQRSAVVGRQKRLQRCLGEFFVERRLISAREMTVLVQQCRTHNRCVQ